MTSPGGSLWTHGPFCAECIEKNQFKSSCCCLFGVRVSVCLDGMSSTNIFLLFIVSAKSIP